MPYGKSVTRGPFGSRSRSQTGPNRVREELEPTAEFLSSSFYYYRFYYYNHFGFVFGGATPLSPVHQLAPFLLYSRIEGDYFVLPWQVEIISMPNVIHLFN